MKLIDYIVAESVRPEIGGKITVVGMYQNTINVSLPNKKPDEDIPEDLTIPLAFLLRFLLEKDETVPDNFKVDILYGKGEKKIPGGGTIQLKGMEGTFLPIPLPTLPVPISQNSEIGLYIELKKGEEILYSTSAPFKTLVQIT